MNHPGIVIDDILERYPESPEYLIFLLQDIQSSYGYISPEAMQLVCDHTGVPETQAYSVATFYQSFRLDPQGEHEIRVCLGTACHLKGGQRIVEELERKLDIDLDTIEPLSKIVIFNLGQVFSLLDTLNGQTLKRIRFDGENLWIQSE